MERLLQIKREHEHNNTETPTVSEDVVSALLEHLATHVHTGPNSVVIVQSGLSYDDARQVALDVYRENALELSGVAKAIATERAESVTNAFLEKLFGQTNDKSARECLTDPDMQHTIYGAQLAAARSGAPDLCSVLVDLLVDRAKADADLMKLVLNEAVVVASKLTPDQFDALALIFVLRHSRNFGVRDQATFCKYLDATVFPLLQSASRTQARFQHLQYTGCLAHQTFSAELIQLFAASYPHLVNVEIARGELTGIQRHGKSDPDALLGHVLIPGDGGLLKLLPRFDVEYEPLLSAAGVTPESCQLLKRLIEQKATRLFESALPTLHPRIDELLKYWTTFASAMTLTSVGIAIGHSNLRRRGLSGYNLATWIN